MEVADDGLVIRLRNALRIVSGIAHRFTEATSDYARLLEVIAHSIGEVIPDTCVVMLRDGEQLCVAALHTGTTDDRLGLRATLHRAYPLHQVTLSASVLANGPLLVPSLDADHIPADLPRASIEPMVAGGVTGALAVPLAIGGELYGVIWVLRHGAVRPPLDDVDFEIATDLAGHAALAISNARMMIALQHSEQLRIAEERAVQASRLVDAILENIPDMVFVKDAERLAFVRLNRAGEQLLGMSRDDVIGKTDHDFFPPDQAEFFVGKDRETLRGGPMVEIPEEPIETRHGRRWLHTKKVALRDSTGAPSYLLGISHDITDSKHALAELSAAKAAAEYANHELESFSYSVAHDLRTPLRAIDGFSQALAEDFQEVLPEEGRRYLARIRQAAQRMAELIDDLLTLSRVTRTEVRRERVDLSALALTRLTGLQRLEPERLVELVIAPGIVAEADPQLTAIALENLLGNAWKFTSKRHVARIELGVEDTSGERVYYVRDNGAGFDMAYRDKLFGVFQRLHHEKEFPGTGVGLATVARITQRHRGRIWADGRPDHGATFYFTLMEPHA